MNDRGPSIETISYTYVTDFIIFAMERGREKLIMPWHLHNGNTPASGIGTAENTSLPLNVVTKEPYRLVNVVSLWAATQMRDHKSNLWGTVEEWKQVGGQVRETASGAPVVTWKERPPANEYEAKYGEPSEPIPSSVFSVYNAAQVDNFQAPRRDEAAESERLKELASSLDWLRFKVRAHAMRPSYSDRYGSIFMPPVHKYEKLADYYSTLTQEAIHWGRQLVDKPDMRDELVGELGAAFHLAKFGIGATPRVDHEAFEADWYKLLRKDNRAIFTAAWDAQQGLESLAEMQKVFAPLYPDPRESIQERALRRAERVLHYYSSPGHKEANLTASLTDFMHWAKKHGVSFDKCLHVAEERYSFGLSMDKCKRDGNKVPMCEVWHAKRRKAPEQRFPDDFEHVASVKTYDLRDALEATMNKDGCWWQAQSVKTSYVIVHKKARSTLSGDVIVTPDGEAHLCTPQKVEAIQPKVEHEKKIEKSR